MLRGAIPVDGSTSRFLRDFFLYWPLVSPYPSGRDDEYETVKENNERGGVQGAKKKARMKRRTHGLQFRLAPPRTDRFKEPEHGTLQWFSGILPGDILKVGREVRARMLDIIKLYRHNQYERPHVRMKKPRPHR